MDDKTTYTPESTRTEIILAAHSLFVKQGYHGTSMRQIAAHAEIALGSIYNHFESKEAIFVAVFRAYHPYQEVMPAFVQTGDEQIEILVRSTATQLIQALEHRPDFLNLALIEIVEFNSKHVGEIFIEIFPDVVESLQQTFLKDPRIREIPLLILIRYFIGLFFSYYVTSKLLGNVYIPNLFQEHDIDFFIDIFLHGILHPDQAGKDEPA